MPPCAEFAGRKDRRAGMRRTSHLRATVRGLPPPQNRFAVLTRPPGSSRGGFYASRSLPSCHARTCGLGAVETVKPSTFSLGRSGCLQPTKKPAHGGLFLLGWGDADQKRALLRTIVGISTRLMPMSMRSRLENRITSSEVSRYFHQVRKASAKRLIMVRCLSCSPGKRLFVR